MYQQLWRYKIEEKLYLGVPEQKMLNTTDLLIGVKQNKVVLRPEAVLAVSSPVTADLP
jgi:hypothetical protein